MLALALAGLLPVPASAIDIRYTLGASVLRTDNVGLSELDPVEETVLSPHLRFTGEQAGSAVRVQFTGDLAYLHYVDNSFDDEVRGELSGEMEWEVVPERLDFIVKDYLSRQPISVLTGFNPANQQQVNVFIAGPTLTLRFAPATIGQVDLRYSNSYAEESRAFNSDRYNIAGRLLHDLGPTSTLSANVESTRVDYDIGGDAVDYTRQEAYLGFTRELRTLDLLLDVGYSRIERDAAAPGVDASQGSPMARTRVTWHATPRSDFDASLSYQFADAAQDVMVRAGQSIGPLIPDLTASDVLVGPSVYRQRRVELGYQFNGDRLTFRARPYYQRLRYLDPLVLDQTWRGGMLGLDYRLTSRMTASFAAGRERREFVDGSRVDTDSAYHLALDNQLTPHWSWRIDLQRRERSSSVPLQSYDENAVVFSIAYSR